MFGEFNSGMSTRRNFAVKAFTIAACLVMGSFAVSPSACAAECTGLPSLEARLHAHPDANAYADLGAWFYDQYKTDCAVETVRAGLKLEPDSARLNYILGLSLYTVGRMQDAVAPFRKSLRGDPGDTKAHLLLGVSLASLNRNQEALPEWYAVLKIDPTSMAAIDGLARSLIAVGDYETVIRRLHSISLDENLSLDLATAYRNAGDLDSATQVLTEGLKSYPDSDTLTEALVSIDAQQSRNEEATALAEKLAGRKPNDIAAQQTYLWMLEENKDDELAAPLARKLLMLAPHDINILYMSGILERRAGDYAEARKNIEEAVALDHDRNDTRYNLGVVLAQLGDAAGAKAQFEKAIELGASGPEIRFELAKVLRNLGQSEEAQQQLKIYQQKQVEKSSHELATLKSTEAAQAIKAGDNRKAADLYREACAAQPDNAEFPYRLALALHELGDSAGERAADEQAVKDNPNFAPAQYHLGYLESQAGEYAAAEQQFRSALKTAPGNIQAWIALAFVLSKESRIAEAQQALNNAIKLDPGNPQAIEVGRNLSAAQRQQ